MAPSDELCGGGRLLGIPKPHQHRRAVGPTQQLQEVAAQMLDQVDQAKPLHPGSPGHRLQGILTEMIRPGHDQHRPPARPRSTADVLQDGLE